MSTEIPSFLLRREDKSPDSGRKRPRRDRYIGPPPWRNPYDTSEGTVTLVKAITPLIAPCGAKQLL